MLVPQGGDSFQFGRLDIGNKLALPAPSRERADDHIALNDKLAVVVAPAPVFDFPVAFRDGAALDRECPATAVLSATAHHDRLLVASRA